MKTILFQGDSITDVGRNRESLSDLGKGYPLLVGSRMGLDCPGEYTFINRGISGNRVVDIYSRIKADIINLKPDYMSILIGVNDVWHELHMQNGVEAEKYEKVYRMIIDEVKQALPNIKIMIIEPFLLRGASTEENFDLFKEEVLLRAAAAKRIAEDYGLPFIPLQKDLDELSQKAPNEYWLYDGVHPSCNFHQRIAEKWIETFKSIQA